MNKTNDLATKEFVKETVDEAVKDLSGEMKKNQEVVLERLDSIMDSIKKFDEEETGLAYRVSEHSDQLEDHEDRLKRIEKTTIPS